MAKSWKSGTTLRDRTAVLSASLRSTLGALVELAEIEERFPDKNSGVVVIGPSPWKWRSPSDEEVVLLQRARRELDAWLALAGSFLRGNAPELVDDFDGQTSALRSVVDRSGAGTGPEADTKERILEYVDEALASQLETLRLAGMIAAPTGEHLIVPDTNALYANPALEEWEGSAPAALVLTPAVIQELDHHKAYHASESIRKKALSLTKRIEELRRRGDLVEGVKLTGALHFRVVPFEPGEDDALPWMRLDAADDRILATVLGIGRREPNANLVFVTNDANLRTKAALAGIALDSPPPSSRPEPAVLGEQAQKGLPDVALGHPSSRISLASALAENEKRRLIRVEPRYPIENKGSSSIRDVTTGVRTHDGREHEFSTHRAQLIAAGEVSWVESVGSIPEAWLAEIHESIGADGFLYWARFSDKDGKQWEVVYDAGTRTTEWLRAGESAERAEP